MLPAVIGLLMPLWISGMGAFHAVAAPEPEVDVLLWFDTEDFLLPADDDATLRLAELLHERGIRATFKVVGEKARRLRWRNRKDVIEALRQHSIGYHSNWHSVHPTPSEYLADCGWLDGIAEFMRHEAMGAIDVRQVFKVETLSCYGQPGSSWAPQAVAALEQLGIKSHGIPCYVDEGQHVGLNHEPFWYAGALHVFNMGRGVGYTRMELHDEKALAPAREEVSAMAERLRSKGGGLISIFYHPCEWVHQEFWDGVNFARGANPIPVFWKKPGQRPAAETNAAFQRFEAYIDHIRTLPGVRFVTADDLPALYPDPARNRGASLEEVRDLARRIVDKPGQVDCISDRDVTYSPADQFELCLRALASKANPRTGREPFKVQPLLGPDGLPPQTECSEMTWPEFRMVMEDTLSFVKHNHRVPARVFLGTQKIAPADFLAAMASVLVRPESEITDRAKVKIPQGTTVATEKYIAADTPKLFGDWVIHRENFQAPKILEMGRLQAWTLKPALRSQAQPR